MKVVQDRKSSQISINNNFSANSIIMKGRHLEPHDKIFPFIVQVIEIGINYIIFYIEQKVINTRTHNHSMDIRIIIKPVFCHMNCDPEKWKNSMEKKTQ